MRSKSTYVLVVVIVLLFTLVVQISIFSVEVLEISFNQLTGAMLEVERQIVEEQKKLEPEKKEEKANAT